MGQLHLSSTIFQCQPRVNPPIKKLCDPEYQQVLGKYFQMDFLLALFALPPSTALKSSAPP